MSINTLNYSKTIMFLSILCLAIISLAFTHSSYASELKNTKTNNTHTDYNSDNFGLNNLNSSGSNNSNASSNYNSSNNGNTNSSSNSSSNINTNININNIIINNNNSNAINVSNTIFRNVNSSYINSNENNNSGNLSVPNVYGSYDEGVVLSAILTDQNNNPLSDRLIEFFVDGEKVGEAITNSLGIANLNYKPKAYDNYFLRASYYGNDYPTEDAVAGLIIQGAKAYLKVNPASGTFGKNITISAILTDKNNKAIINKLISFYIDGIRIGQATTNSQGLAKFTYGLDAVGNFLITAKYNGNDYKPDDATGKLAVSKVKTQIFINDFKGYYNEKSAIIVTLNTGVESLSGKKVKFYVNNKLVGNGTINNQSMAGLIYKVKSIGKFKITTVFVGDENHTSVSKSRTFNIPSSTLFVVNNKLIKGKKVYLQTTLVNIGPKKSYVKITFKVPKKMKYYKPKVSTGKIKYNAKKRTLIWIIKKLKVHKSKSARLYWVLTAKKGKYSVTTKVNKLSTTRLEYNNKLSFKVK